MTEELKPCPFCGCDVASRQWTFRYDSYDKGAQYIQCPLCGIRTPTMNNEYELIALWNTRVNE